jgi:hypothetical protein
LHFLGNSRQICRDHLQHLTSSEMSIVFMMRNTLLALDDFVIIDNTFGFLSSRACPCYGCNLLSNLYGVLPWSITVFYAEYVVRIAPPLGNTWHRWYLSSLPFFLGPRVDSNRDTNMQAILLGFRTSINPMALKLTIDSSFLTVDYWIVTLTLIVLPMVIFRAHLSTND